MVSTPSKAQLDGIFYTNKLSCAGINQPADVAEKRYLLWLYYQEIAFLISQATQECFTTRRFCTLHHHPCLVYWLHITESAAVSACRCIVEHISLL